MSQMRLSRLLLIIIILAGCSHKAKDPTSTDHPATTEAGQAEIAKASPTDVATQFIEAYSKRDSQTVAKFQCGREIRNLNFTWIALTDTGIEYQLGDEVITESNIILNGKRLNTVSTVNMSVRRKEDGFHEAIGVYLRKIDDEWKVCGIGHPGPVPAT